MLSEVLLEFRTIVSGNSSCKASDDRDDRARGSREKDRERRGRRPKELGRLLAMLIAIANTAVKARKGGREGEGAGLLRTIL